MRKWNKGAAKGAKYRALGARFKAENIKKKVIAGRWAVNRG